MERVALRKIGGLLLFIFFIVQPAKAQDNPLLYKEIQLTKKTYTFDELTHSIQEQTGITFSYNASKINANRHFRIKAERMTVVKLFAFIHQKSGIGYKMISPKLIIYTPPAKSHHHKRQKKRTNAKNKIKHTAVTKLSGSENIAKNQPKEEHRNINVISDTVNTETIVVIGDSSTASGYYYGGGGGGGKMGTINMVMRYPNGHDNIVNPYASLSPPGSQAHLNNFSSTKPNIGAFVSKNLLLEMGLSADETYYFNPSLRFGFRFLYASISYSIGRYSQWRHGLGAKAKLNNKWSLQIDFNTGKPFSKTFPYSEFDTLIMPNPDSLIPPPPPVITETQMPVTVHSTLSQFTLSLVRQLNNNLSIAGGISLNQLKSQYFSEGKPFDLNSMKPTIPNAENHFRTLKPPYILSESYKAADATGMKLWLGFKISLFWRLNFVEN